MATPSDDAPYGNPLRTGECPSTSRLPSAPEKVTVKKKLRKFDRPGGLLRFCASAEPASLSWRLCAWRFGIGA